MVVDEFVKRNNIKFDNIDFKRSVVQQRVDDNHNVTWTEMLFEEFFDCECKKKDEKKNHDLPNCNIYKRRMYKELKEGKLVKMNERNSLVKYDSLRRKFKPDYIIFYWVKNLNKC